VAFLRDMKWWRLSRAPHHGSTGHTYSSRERRRHRRSSNNIIIIYRLVVSVFYFYFFFFLKKVRRFIYYYIFRFCFFLLYIIFTHTHTDTRPSTHTIKQVVPSVTDATERRGR
jgi:hypothetical protein